MTRVVASDGPAGHRYREIADRLFGDIRTGRYPVGGRLPTENALAEEYRVSRHTARHAVQELERLGLVSRNRGGGTIVMKADPRPRFINSITSVGELLQYAAVTRLEVRRIRQALALPPVDVPIAGRADDWTHIEGVRRLDPSGEILCWTDIFLHPEVADVAPLVGRDQRPVYRLVEEHHNLLLGSITQAIDAVTLSGDIAAALGVRTGTAGLKLTRCYHDLARRVLQIAVNLHAGGQFSYKMAILRDPTQPAEP